MSRGKLLLVGMMVALLMSVGAGVANAQGGGGGRQRGNGGGGGGGGFDPAAFQAQREQRMKDALGVTDDEWKVLQPRIQKVTQAQTDLRGGMFGGRGRGMGGGGGGGGGGGMGAGGQPADAATQSAVAKATQELRTLLENKDAAAADIKAKLTALRDARDKAKKDLAAAQAALKEVCNARGEAYFVMTGMMD